MAKIRHDVKTTVDGVYLFTARGWVSGTAAAVTDMTGNLVRTDNNTTYKSTDPEFTILYGSGSLRDVNNQGLPTGSMRLVMANPAVQVMHWGVEMEASGTDARANSLSSANQYRIVKYGHRAAVSGTTTFDFGFQRISGALGANQVAEPFGFGFSSGTMSGTYDWVGSIPRDNIRTASPAAEWTLWAFLRRNSRDS